MMTVEELVASLTQEQLLALFQSLASRRNERELKDCLEFALEIHGLAYQAPLPRTETY